MLIKKLRLKLRRIFRRQRRQAADIGASTGDSMERYVFKRLMRLFDVRRFVLGWVGLMVVLAIGVILQTQALSSFYTQTKPVSGGTFREGMIGKFTNANPIFAQSDVDGSVSKLVFSGLFKVDNKGKLIPDLAETFNVDKSETVYTVKLKKNVKWHDGQPFTAKDVIFTYKSIQDPEAESFLAPSWNGVTISAEDDYTVVFTLSTALSGFSYSMTNGIIPEHILSGVNPGQLRSNDFNNLNPVGTGPFSFEVVEVDANPEASDTRVSLANYPDYHLSRANLERFIFRTYKDEESLTEAFKKSQVDSMVGLKTAPEDIDETKSTVNYIPLAGEIMVFFNNSQDVLKETKVRQALVLAIDKKEVFEQIDHPVLSVDSPLLKSHDEYDQKYAQKSGNKTQAEKVLDTIGWEKDPASGIRTKDKKELRFTLHSSTNSEFQTIVNNLQSQWQSIGVEVEIILSNDDELQPIIKGHTYDALMFGILLGYDPDVYPFWHSSQGKVNSDTRLNFSEYNSKIADQALEASRTRSDPRNRAIKIEPFLEAWQKDYPALALYQPQLVYITAQKLSGFDFGVLQSSTDRYVDVNEWKVRTSAEKIE